MCLLAVHLLAVHLLAVCLLAVRLLAVRVLCPASVAVSELPSLMLVALTAVAEGTPLIPASVAPSQATFLTLPQCDPCKPSPVQSAANLHCGVTATAACAHTPAAFTCYCSPHYAIAARVHASATALSMVQLTDHLAAVFFREPHFQARFRTCLIR